MQSQTALDMIAKTGLMAGMRGDFPPDKALRMAEVLMAEGINNFEFLMNSVEPIAAMQAVKREYGDAVCAGMGTVLDAETARRVLDAGADFIVSPGFQPAVVQTVLDAGTLFAPGVTTSSEAVNAWEMGVPLLKLFPIGVLGLEYFKAMLGPLSHMKFMCNGGMNADNAPQFIEAGAVACGMAGWLTGTGDLPLETVRERAHKLRAAVDAVRAPVQD